TLARTGHRGTARTGHRGTTSAEGRCSEADEVQAPVKTDPDGPGARDRIATAEARAGSHGRTLPEAHGHRDRAPPVGDPLGRVDRRAGDRAATGDRDAGDRGAGARAARDRSELPARRWPRR